MKHRALLLLLLATLAPVSLLAQTQTPRQALIEMLSGRDKKGFERHLPKIMQQRLAKLDEGSRGRFTTSPADLPMGMSRKNYTRWFETGPILMLAKDENSRMEVRVAKDELNGDRDDIELSFDLTMNGTHYGGNDTRVLLTMQNEDHIWRLSEVGLTLKMKLDGSFLETFANQMKQAFQPMGATSATTLTVADPIPSRKMSAKDLSTDENVALDALRKMLTAERNYRSANPANGFTCNSNDLATDEVNGYRAMVVGCKGTPVANFKITLTPIGLGVKGKRAFCTDESGVLRYSDDGKGVNCLSENNRIE